MSREVCIHGIGISNIKGCPDCQKCIETFRANELKYFLAEGKIALLEHRLNIAEAKLTRLGYERECNMPACNCGDGWTHKRTEI